jgi:hypothetical protein
MKISAATQLRSGTRRGHAAAVTRWGWRQERLDALPQPLRQESVHETGHARRIQQRPEALKRPAGRSGMSTKLVI